MEWGEGRERGGNEVWAWGGVVSDTECALEPLKLESDSTVGMSHSYDASTGTVVSQPIQSPLYIGRWGSAHVLWGQTEHVTFYTHPHPHSLLAGHAHHRRPTIWSTLPLLAALTTPRRRGSLLR